MQAGLLTNIPIPSSHTAQHYVVDAQRAFEFNQICQSDTHNRWDGHHGHESRFAGKCRRPRWSLRSPRLHPMHTGPANNAYTDFPAYSDTPLIVTLLAIPVVLQPYLILNFPYKYSPSWEMYLYVLISTEYRLQCTYFDQRLDKNAKNTIKITQNFLKCYA